MNDARTDCLCLGIVVADHVCDAIDHLPRSGELVLTARTSLTVGGCAANVAVNLARLGRRAAVVGRVGDDFFGRFIADGLEQSGVDLRHLRATPGEATSCSMIVNVRGDDRRFIHARGANQTLTGGEISPEMLRQARVVYVGGYCLSDQPSPDNIASLFRAASECGSKTVLDVVIPRPADYWSFLEPVLPWTDVFLPNNDEGEAITGEKDPFAQADRFRAAGAKSVVITCGRHGSVAVSSAARFRTGRFQVDQIDGTGSGDAFAAGYIHGLLEGEDVVGCVRIGSALGASCVRATGATTGVFNAGELADFLAAHAFETQVV
jgi:sugar/nucleoside kinase (ribokinase family)